MFIACNGVHNLPKPIYRRNDIRLLKEFAITNAPLFYEHLATTWLWRAGLLELRFMATGVMQLI